MENSKQIFMTGATSGFGKVACVQLLTSGHNVIVGYRDNEKANSLSKEIDELLAVNKGVLTLIPCDLSSFHSIKSACETIKSTFSELDELILNGGTWNFSFNETADGIEEIFQVNFLANVLLINELQELVTNSERGKIILTASALHQGKINFEDLELRKNFSGYNSYRQSKLGVLLLTRLLSESMNAKHVGMYCLHPGLIKTELGRHAGKFFNFIFKLIGSKKQKGANAILFLSKTDKRDLIQGGYYANNRKKKTTKESYDMQVAKELLKYAFEYLAPLNVINKLT